MGEHTNTPWRTDELEHDTPYEPVDILGENGDLVCRFWIDDAPVPEYNRRQKANARYIVHCVNNHARLVEALQRLVRDCDNLEYEAGRVALSQYDAEELLDELEAGKGGE